MPQPLQLGLASNGVKRSGRLVDRRQLAQPIRKGGEVLNALWNVPLVDLAIRMDARWGHRVGPVSEQAQPWTKAIRAAPMQRLRVAEVAVLTVASSHDKSGGEWPVLFLKLGKGLPASLAVVNVEDDVTRSRPGRDRPVPSSRKAAPSFERREILGCVDNVCICRRVLPGAVAPRVTARARPIPRHPVQLQDGDAGVDVPHEDVWNHDALCAFVRSGRI